MKLAPTSIALGCAALALFAATQASAQTALQERQISIAMAQDAANATLEQCRKGGFKVTVAVLNNAGQLKALLRDDGTGPHTVDTARRKAYTSLTTRAPTTGVAKRIAGEPAAFQNLNNITDVLVLGGGIPIKIGAETIGAIGVSGAPTGEQDEACGQAGIDKIAAALK